MMRKKIKRLITFTLGISIIFSSSIIKNVSANSYNNNGYYNNYNKLRVGVKNKKYYVDPSTTSSYWDTIFDDSFYLWSLTNTQINFNRTSNYNDSTIDCYTTSDVYEYNIQGWASFYIFPSTFTNGYSSSWDYGTITLNRAYLQETTYMDDTKVTMHELGHVFGLYHVKNAYDLMYETSVGHKTYRPSTNDINRINTLYK